MGENNILGPSLRYRSTCIKQRYHSIYICDAIHQKGDFKANLHFFHHFFFSFSKFIRIYLSICNTSKGGLCRRSQFEASI